MAKQTMDAIRQAELNAEQTLKAAQSQAGAKIDAANAQAEAMLTQARQNAAKLLADTRAAAERDAQEAAAGVDAKVSREIEVLRRQGQKNEAKAIKAIIASMR